MSKKERIKEFLDFKTLITEVVLKYVFIALAALGALVAVVSIFSGWIAAFSAIRWDFFRFLGLFFGTPILSVIVLVVYLFFLRIGFESVLIRFLTYRELRQINEKTPSEESDSSDAN